MNDVTNELDGAKNSLNEGDDITVPGISNEKANEKTDENSSPRGGNTTSDLTPTPTILMNTDTSQK